MQADITITGQGFYQIAGESKAGRDWIQENVSGAQMEFGEALAYSDQTNLAQDIAEGATGDGLSVAVNGYLYLAGGGRGEAIA